eukprot:TRINITY_DN4103_c0_g1_i1.p1 TRINITY_DN4103_c0_g1~~TRINITY_DN4103_c0_g1_i1.p1  ORF type:complete len:243 (+),score=67.07 TRINITY_DN4103_c0_g1_i1:49-777(+)
MKYFAIGILFVIFFVTVNTENFEPQKVQLIDFNSETGNFLFRGNEPLNSTGFAYDQLVSTLKERANNASIEFPSKFTLLDVTFLNHLKKEERDDLRTERKFFKQNPELGAYVHHFMMGSIEPPNIYITKKDKLNHALTMPEWDIDKLPQLIRNVRDQIETPAQYPVVVYGHCEAGTDRTGEFSAAYYMQYKNMTLQQSIDLDTEISGRSPHTVNIWASEWYCYYLVAQFNFDLSCKYKENNN